MNFSRPGDVMFVMSVSGSSPNLVKAAAWAKVNGVRVIALVGAKRGELPGMADISLVVQDEHYGRVEDAHMGICHMIAYAFMEQPDLQKR
jgi:D-sedoheptulose 7-phosphate isomerase